nr:replication protein A 70 kDa DNA-binding subunit B-like [Ziziphus jujuba var. spinosa]
MIREIKLIKDIQAQQRGWTVKVVVIEKAMPRVSKSSPNKYQRLILADEEGNKIQATIYGGDIHIFRDTLIIGKNYYISNAWVKEIGAQYQIVQNNLQWTINGRTIVEEVTGDSEIIVPAVYNFVPFSRLHTYIDSLSHVDVIGIAIEIKPKKEIITNDGLEIVQEMTLMNDNMDTVMLTMWNQFVNNECTQILNIMNRKPIIIGCRLKVSSYNGISLSTKSSSSFVIEPEIPQAAALPIWYNANAEKAMDIICGRIGLETKSLSTLPSAEDIITIKMIDNQLNTRRSFWINGHIKVTNLIQPFWYLSCEKCTKATGYEFEQRFNCFYCRHDQVKAMPRCRVIVDLIDESSSLNATLFGNQAEKFLGCTAYELMNKSDGVRQIQ